MKLKSLSAKDLVVPYNSRNLGFKTTDDLEDLDCVLGQDRALEAIRFGTEIASQGFNLFLLGEEGTGRNEVVRDFLQEKARSMEVPEDWVYVHNFEVSHKPRAIRMPPGRAKILTTAMEAFIEDVRAAVPDLLEGEETQSRLQALQEKFQEKSEAAFEELRQEAEAKQIALIRTPMGFGFAPIIGDEVAKPEIFEKLPRAEQKRYESDIQELETKLQAIIKRIPTIDKERREAIRDFLSETTALAVGAAIEPVIGQFRDLPEVLEHLNRTRDDMVRNFHSIHLAEKKSESTEVSEEGRPSSFEIGGFDRYKVNPIVAHDGNSGAPVIFEDNPTFSNLMGRVEHISRLGTLITDFSLIKAGSLHRANGGFIIIDVLKLLRQPFSWDSLKRALKGQCVTIESVGQMLGLISTISLEPEPIPLNVKVVLTGSRWLYYLLSAYDPEFPDLFKVEADFDRDMERNGAAESLFPRMIATQVRKDGLKPFDASAVALVMQRAIRMAADREKISVHQRSISNLLHEAAFYAGQDGVPRVSRKHVSQAIEKKEARSDRLREKVYEMITRDIVLLSTEGHAVGQVNGLSIIELGGFAFGRPTRITARVRLGAGKVIDIEREVELGGPIHSKGVMILSGFLAARYAVDHPLSLAATIVFEQSYGGVEGDSASSAELYALLSALSDLPLRQDLAVTGSVNQFGEVQVIGGVNEKIEGFFDICKRRGLTGTQGVLIPATNKHHLMLRDEVVDAVKAGTFHIYPISTIDEGITLLTGVGAGKRDARGRYRKGTVNEKVEARMMAFADARRAFGSKDTEKENGGNAKGRGS
ncbi:MAG: AAA family ATPase [Alphaproteobacteria bacterium]|nr:AAA family ATPase [Alphaproteobacteria bacterium]